MATFFVMNETGSVVLNKTAHMSRVQDMQTYLTMALVNVVSTLSYKFDTQNPFSAWSLSATVPFAGLAGYALTEHTRAAGLKWDTDGSTVLAVCLAIVGSLAAQWMTAYFDT